MSSGNYPRYLEPNFKPYDPLAVTEVTKSIVCKKERGGELRKYSDIYVAGVYKGIVTGCVVGCNLRCFYCWSPLSRDFPENYGKFYTPENLVKIMENLGKKYYVRKARISCGEPTICWEHLINVIKLIEESKWFDLFILETNGLIIGAKPELVNDLKKFNKLYVRISIKAGYPDKFTWRTGAKQEFLELQYKAIEALNNTGIKFHVAAMTDPRIMESEERLAILRKIAKINYYLALTLEEEVIDPYKTTIFRLEKAGIKLKWKKYFY